MFKKVKQVGTYWACFNHKIYGGNMYNSSPWVIL